METLLIIIAIELGFTIVIFASILRKDYREVNSSAFGIISDNVVSEYAGSKPAVTGRASQQIGE